MAVLTSYKRPAKVNPYTQEVAEAIAAGEGAAIELVALTKSAEGKRQKTYTGEKAKLQDAARAAGVSARQVEIEHREDGFTRGVFILGAERKRTVKPKPEKPGK